MLVCRSSSMVVTVTAVAGAHRVEMALAIRGKQRECTEAVDHSSVALTPQN